jgi:hypothetical protein
MPLVRISLRAGKPAAYKAAIVEATYQAMRAEWNLVEVKAENWSFGNGIAQYVKP